MHEYSLFIFYILSDHNDDPSYHRENLCVVFSISQLLPPRREHDQRRDAKFNLDLAKRERGWISEYVYQYEGFWYPSTILQGLVACKNHFQAKDTDIVLATCPKAGTTWLKAMAFALVNRSTPDPDRSLLTTNPHDLVPYFEIDLYCETNNVPDLSAFASPRLFATHIPIGSLPRSVKDSGCKIVYLCRNPKHTFVSTWHFSNKLRPQEVGPMKLEDMFNMFCDGVYACGPFFDHVLGYWKESLESSRKVLFLKYEDIKEQPAGELRKLAEFLECPFSNEEESKGMVDEILKLCSFDYLSNLKVNKTEKSISSHGRLSNSVFFRKGEVGDWVNLLTPDMIKKIDDIKNMKLLNSQLNLK